MYDFIMAAKRPISAHLTCLCLGLLLQTAASSNQLSIGSLSLHKTAASSRSQHYLYWDDGRLSTRRAIINRYIRINDNAANGSVIEKLRGGAIQRQVQSTHTTKVQPTQSNVSTIATITILSLTILLSILNWETLVISLSAFFDRERFRTRIIETLNSISDRGMQGLLMYTFGFIFWETCGLPTSVVETAAGMAFGFKDGLLCSFVGKTLGSILAFTLGRSFCHSFVKKQLQNNEVLELMERSVAKSPMQSALIVRYSPFPQLIKNFGLSMMEPVQLTVFLLAICIHGFPFSILWAALGHDSSLRLRAEENGQSLAVNWVLNGALVFVTVFGFIVSPAITGWWLAGLRKNNGTKTK